MTKNQSGGPSAKRPVSPEESTRRFSSLDDAAQAACPGLRGDARERLKKMSPEEERWFRQLASVAVGVDERPKAGRQPVSNLRSAEHTYVDLVIGGGAMLALASAGYIHALEREGIRFRAIAGTSSGALCAALMTAIGPAEEPKGLKLAAIIATMPIRQFLGIGPVRLLFWLNARKGLRWAAALVLFASLLKVVFFHYLISGNEFETWLQKKLSELHEGHEVDESANCWRTSWDAQDWQQSRELNPRLALIAADITREQIIEFPAAGELIAQEDRFLARYVRASTSIPIAFKPVKVQILETSDSPSMNVKLVDGGLMSNFPIAVFHRTDGQPPELPTFGVKLDPDAGKSNSTFWIWEYVVALVKTVLHVSDDEFIRRHPDFAQLVTTINIGDIDQFNVFMKEEEKLRLFEIGVRAGQEFLGTFNWERYRGYRNTHKDS